MHSEPDTPVYIPPMHIYVSSFRLLGLSLL